MFYQIFLTKTVQMRMNLFCYLYRCGELSCVTKLIENIVIRFDQCNLLVRTLNPSKFYELCQIFPENKELCYDVMDVLQLDPQNGVVGNTAEWGCSKSPGNVGKRGERSCLS